LEEWSGRWRGRAPFSQASTSTHGGSGAGKRFLQSGRKSAGLGSRRGCSCSARQERFRAASTNVACRSSRRRRARRQRGQPMERKSAGPAPSDCCSTRGPVTVALATSRNSHPLPWRLAASARSLRRPPLPGPRRPEPWWAPILVFLPLRKVFCPALAARFAAQCGCGGAPSLLRQPGPARRASAEGTRRVQSVRGKGRDVST
jgi:hypothetical protein